MYFKKFIWKDNNDYWKEHIKICRKTFFRFIIFIILIIPPMLLALIKFKTTWIDLFFAFLMGIAFSLGFLFF